MKDKLIAELKKNWIPDFSLFRQKEAFSVLPELLDDLLREEKEKFEALIQKKGNELQFSDFVESSDFDYLWRIINHLDNCYNESELRNIISDFRPHLQDLVNEQQYSKEYYEKLLWMRDNYPLDADQKRIIELWIKNYQQRGIDLPQNQQEEIKKINKEYSKQSEIFQHNVVDDQAGFLYHLEDDSTLKEMPKSTLEKAEKLAWETSWYSFDADPTMLGDLLKYCSDSHIREEVYNRQQSWASSWKFDNRPIALKLISLSQMKAKILWYKNAAEMFLWDTMAQDPWTVVSFISNISELALKKTSDEMEFLKKVFWIDEIKASDVAYYVRKYKETHYLLDENKIKQYFEFEETLAWLHRFVKSFLWVELRKVVEQWEWEEKWYEVYKDWELVAYYVLDAFYRKGKRPWAWADILREKVDGKLPIIVNVANIQKNEDGKTLLYLRNVETLFHEFWHALHAMLADSKYAYLNWFNIEWDFVELPSQLMENWVNERESLVSLSKHYLTWEPLPNDILDKLDELKTFMMWYFVARQNELALVDNSLYQWKIPENIDELDQKILDEVNKHSYFQRWDEYKMYCAFLHIFGWGYEAKYYSYMWAEAYWADVFSKIKEEWMFNSEIGYKYRDCILKEWCRKDAKLLFEDFMGRSMNPEELMKKYWLL